MPTPGQLNHRAALFEQLGTMIAAGVPLTKAMELAGRNRSLGVPKRAVQELTRRLQEGHTFTDAMQLVSGQKRGIGVSVKPVREYWLSEFDVALLSAGEESGRLDTVFNTLARYYRARATLIRETVVSLIITIVTLHVFVIVFPIGLLQNFAVGLMQGPLSKCLPFIFEKTIVFGLLYGVVWFLAFASQGNRGAGWRSVVEAIVNLVPGLRTAVKCLVVARLSMTLDALLSAGVPVLRSWELAADSCGSPRLKQAILSWMPKLEAGTTPAEMVAQIPYFPDMFTQLYHTGEISGRTDETLERLHTYFENEGVHKLKIFFRFFGFLVYFGIAGLVGYNVIRFWTQYFGNLTTGF